MFRRRCPTARDDGDRRRFTGCQQHQLHLARPDDAAAELPGKPSLRVAKMYINRVNLPDTSIVEIGGGSTNQIQNASRSVGQFAFGWTGWRQMNPLPTGEHRLYHSMAFLLDDGPVVSMGSNPSGGARRNTVLVYEPPYLFRGTRPTIGALPSRITSPAAPSMLPSAREHTGGYDDRVLTDPAPWMSTSVPGIFQSPMAR